MWITSWNIRGFNNTLRIHLLKRRIGSEKLVIVFLQETKCSEAELKDVGKKVWHGSEAIAVDAKGETRGSEYYGT